MARKRVNTGLIAGLTISAMVVTVAVVGVAIFVGAERSPEEYARIAKELEQKGDRERAAITYAQAYRAGEADKDPNYIIQAARLRLSLGDYRSALGLLNSAHSADPTNTPILEATLNTLWEVGRYGPTLAINLRDTADALLEVDPNHTMGLVARAQAHDLLPQDDQTNAAAGEAAYERAVELAPNHPRVVQLRAERVFRIANRGGSAEETLQRVKESQAEASEILDAGLAENPHDPELTLTYARILSENPVFRALPEFFAEVRQTEKSRALLEAAVAAYPDNPDLRLALATLLLSQAEQLEDPAAKETIIATAEQHAQRAIEVEPAMYPAFTVLAHAAFLRTDPDTDPAADLNARYRRVLDIFDSGIDAGVNAETLRAQFAGASRLEMLWNAFNQANAFWEQTDAEDQKAVALEHAARYLDAARVSYGDAPLTALMEGRHAIRTNQTLDAIRAFLRLAERTATPNSPQMIQLNREANMRLAMLYNQRGQSGEALRYAESAISQYEQTGTKPPMGLVATWLELLARLDRAQEALDAVEGLLVSAPDDPTLLRIKAAALSALDRNDEARAVLDMLEEDWRADYLKASVAAADGDYDEAEAQLRKVLAKEPDNPRVLRTFMDTMIAADRREALVAYLESRLAESPEPDTGRILNAMRVVATEEDREARDAKVLALLQQTPDAQQREVELYQYYLQRGLRAEAYEHLDALERLAPEEPRVLEDQFKRAMREKDYDKAEEYLVKLSELDADGAGGARFRASLALARGQVDAALRELRAAEAALPPDAGIKLQLAEAFLAAEPQRTTEALEALDQALRIDPRSAPAHRMRFLLRVQEGLSEQSPEYAEELAAALELNPNDPQLRNMQRALDERQNPADAIARRETELERNPDDLANVVRLIMLYLDPDVMAAEKADQALQDGHQIALKQLDGEAGDETMMSNRLQLHQRALPFYVQRGQADTAKQMLRAYVDKTTGDERVRALLLTASLHANLGETDLAAQAYEQAGATADAITSADTRKAARNMVIDNQTLFLFRTNQYDAGIAAAREALDRLGDTEDGMRQQLQLRIIEALIAQNQLAQAEEEINSFRQRWPDDPRGIVWQVQVLRERNDLTAARLHLNQLLETQPEHAWGLYTRGAINLDLRQLDQARQDLLAAKRLAPTAFNMGHRLALSQVYELRGDYRLAEGELVSILEDSPANRAVAQRLSALYMRHGEPDRALDMLAREGAREPSAPFWPYSRGQILLQQREFDAAARAIERALELSDWRDANLILEWGNAMTQAGRAGEVLARIDNLGAAELPPQVRIARAKALLRLDRRQDGLQEIGTALIGASSDWGLLQAVAGRLYQLVPLDDLSAAAEAAIAAASDSPQQQMRLKMINAEILVQADQASAGLQILDDMSVAPDSEDHVQWLLRRATALNKRDGSSEEVRELYEQVLETNPGEITALNNLAYMLANQGSPQEAVKYAERMRSLAIPNSAVWDTIGRVFMLVDRNDEAQVAFQRALTYDALSPEANLHLGQLKVKMGDNRDARELLERAVEVAAQRGMEDLQQEAREALDQLGA